MDQNAMSIRSTSNQSWRLPIAWVAAMLSSSIASGDDHVAAVEPSAFAGGSYCGVHCLHEALRVIGLSVDFDQLIEPKYIGSFEGSSTLELMSAAEYFGALAMPHRGITADYLQDCSDPVILHVAGNALSNSFNHWILFLGMHNGYAKIYDPPGTVTAISMGRLMSISDGVGLVVRPAGGVVGSRIIEWSLLKPVTIVCFGLAFILVQRTSRSARLSQPTNSCVRPRWIADFRNATVLILVGFVGGLVHDAANADGLLRNRAAVNGLTNKFFPKRVNESALDVVREFVASRSGLIVDARSQSAYVLGHIPESVNVPVGCGLFGHRAVVDDAAKLRPICVYCQNQQCLWARDVAFRLIADGYENVSIFAGGWEEWQSAEISND